MPFGRPFTQGTARMIANPRLMAGVPKRVMVLPAPSPLTASSMYPGPARRHDNAITGGSNGAIPLELHRARVDRCVQIDILAPRCGAPSPGSSARAHVRIRIRLGLSILLNRTAQKNSILRLRRFARRVLVAAERLLPFAAVNDGPEALPAASEVYPPCSLGWPDFSLQPASCIGSRQDQRTRGQ